MQATDYTKKLNEAIETGDLFPEARENIKSWLDSNFLPDWALDSLAELIEGNQWKELNDRFYKILAFGTGGMRSRTIGRVTTRSEFSDIPLRPAVGTNTLNDFNVIKATVGLYRYSKSKIESGEVPRLIVAYDVRYFSKHFAQLAASTWGKLGGDALVFEAPRSTPELSFSVRKLNATAGVVITASHNPPHDNGYKVYFRDGGQVVPPHAEGIIEAVNSVPLSELSAYYEVDETVFSFVPKDIDEAYIECLKTNILDCEMLRTNPPKVVFSPIHGVGGVISVPLMRSLGIDVAVVEEQATMDPMFPTVSSPNPENPEALEAGIRLAKEVGAEVVMGTDPDADRMGVAVNVGDDYQILSGNLIGSLLADYRIEQHKALGLIPSEGTKSAALIKTYVTTPLQESIGHYHGLKVINTLTGFKWIGSKLNAYECKLKDSLDCIDYSSLSREERRELLLRHSTYYVFGGEESYGYLGNDSVRDKDANEAVILFCELAAFIKSKGMTFKRAIESIYLKYGFYSEDLLSVVYEGASGAEKIERILESYRSSPPESMGGVPIKSIQNFGEEKITDADGERIPSQNFYMIQLENGYQYAVRGSGTEPKIKFYLFASEKVDAEGDLGDVVQLAKQKLGQLKEAVRQDAECRAEMG